VAEVAPTAGAKDFITFHPETAIRCRNNIGGDKWFPKTGPTRARFELCVAGKERQVASGAAENAGAMFLQQRTGPCAFRSFFSQHGKLRRCEGSFPFRVGFLELDRRRHVLCGRGHRSRRRFCLLLLGQRQEHRTKTRGHQEGDPKVSFHDWTGFDTPGPQPFTGRSILLRLDDEGGVANAGILESAEEQTSAVRSLARAALEDPVSGSRRELIENRYRRFPDKCYNSLVEKKTVRFRNFAEAEKADRDFYRKLSGQERLNILLELSKHEPERRLERVYRVIKLPRR
jgi:hypothetical protein